MGGDITWPNQLRTFARMGESLATRADVKIPNFTAEINLFTKTRFWFSWLIFYFVFQ